MAESETAKRLISLIKKIDAATQQLQQTYQNLRELTEETKKVLRRKDDDQNNSGKAKKPGE